MMRSYKIAMVAACPFPANWGSPGLIRETVESLMRRGHQVHVVTYPFGQDLSVGGAKIWRSWHWRTAAKLHSGPSLEKVIMDPSLVVQLVRVIRRENIEIIHAHNYEGMLAGIVAKFITGRPLVFSPHGLLSDELPGYGLLPLISGSVGRVFDRFVPKFADHIITVTDRLRRKLITLGVDPDDIDAIPPSIDPAMFDNADPEPLRRSLGVESGPVVMYTGICSPLQRLDYLLHAFSRVIESEPKATLVVLTPLQHDPDIAACKQLASSLAIDNRVIWVQGHALSDLRHYLALADVTVISRPNMPGQPIKLLNAMMAGKPTVCFAGVTEGVEHGREVFIAPDHDWRRLGAGILALIRNPGLSREMGRLARETVISKYNSNLLYARVEQIYAKLLGEVALPQPDAAESSRDTNPAERSKPYETVEAGAATRELGKVSM
jgi:glycosyltransferase involved in cell wall biosynthesis